MSESRIFSSPLAGEEGARAEGVGRRGALLARARAMRNEPTDAERVLWRILRSRQLAGFKFRRQQPLERYIADFVCFEHRLVVEADGSQHAESAYDEKRDRWLRDQGFVVLRFSNTDILTNPRGVAEHILRQTPHPPAASRRAPPSPARGEGNGANHG